MSGIAESCLIELAKDAPYAYTEAEIEQSIKKLVLHEKIDKRQVSLAGGGRRWMVFPGLDLSVHFAPSGEITSFTVSTPQMWNP